MPVADKNLKNQTTAIPEAKTPRVKKINKLHEYFDVVKKLFDPLDEIWNALRGFIPSWLVATVPLLMGSIGGIIHGIEFLDNTILTAKAIKNKIVPQRKTKIFTGSLSMFLGLNALGICITYFIDGLKLGWTILGTAYMPILIPGLLASIFALKLGRHAYQLHVAKQNEATALKHLEKTPEKQAVQENYQRLHDKRLNAERHVAFTTAEFTVQVIVTVAMVLGTSALIGAGTVASLGTLPLAILITGAVVSGAIKAFEMIDNHYKNKYTQKIRGWFSPKKVFGTTPKISRALGGTNVAPQNTSNADTKSEKNLSDESKVPSTPQGKPARKSFVHLLDLDTSPSNKASFNSR